MNLYLSRVIKERLVIIKYCYKRDCFVVVFLSNAKQTGRRMEGQTDKQIDI